MVAMKNVGDRGVVRRRRSRGCGTSQGLQFLAEIITTVSECRECCGRHSNPTSCFSAVSKRKREAFLKTHHSLFLLHHRRSTSTHKKPIKLTIKGPRRPKEVSLSPFDLLVSAAAAAAVAAAETPTDIASQPVAAVSAEEEDLPRSLRGRVSESVGVEELGSKFNLVIRKKLKATDLNPHHCRLAIPINQIASDFLTDEEKHRLNRDGGNINIRYFVDPDMEIAPGASLRRWKSGSGYTYNLSGGWKNVLKKLQKNLLKLAEEDEVEVWSFRTALGELCFALITVQGRRKAAVAEKEMKMEHASLINSSTSSSLTQEHLLSSS